MIAVAPTSAFAHQPHGLAGDTSEGFAPCFASAPLPKPLLLNLGDHARGPLQTKSGSQWNLKLAIFDFDNTLTERPLHQILDYKYLKIDEFSQEDLISIIYGGEERLSRMRSFLQTLKEADVELIIVSHGYTHTIREALRRVGILDNFKFIFGGDSADLEAVDSEKVRLVRRLRDARKLSVNQVIFCDHDKQTIECPIRLGNGEVVTASQICRTLGPQQGLQHGLTEAHMNVLLAMVGKELLSRAPSQTLDTHMLGHAHMENTLPSRLKLAIFDFDNTLAEEHLYQTLELQHMTIEQLSQKALVAIFGGEERLRHLGTLLRTLREADVELIIVSHGCTHTIREALRRVGFLDHFKFIFGGDSTCLKDVDLEKVRLVRRLRDARKLSVDQVIFCDDDKKNIESPVTLGNGEVVTASQVCRTLGPQQGLHHGLTDAHMKSLLAML
jgi:phosphoglycolate phosphatase-like HAD superfamily hydrolase